MPCIHKISRGRKLTRNKLTVKQLDATFFRVFANNKSGNLLVCDSRAVCPTGCAFVAAAFVWAVDFELQLQHLKTHSVARNKCKTFSLALMDCLPLTKDFAVFIGTLQLFLNAEIFSI
jgi:hypothetical protein